MNGRGATAEGDAELHGSGSAESEADAAPATTAAPAAQAKAVAAPQPGARVLLGARHDLKLRSGQGTASCECLSVALGGAHNAAMQWSATTPNIDEGTQLTIALSSEGQACKGEPKKSMGASYWGYRLSGNDVVVLVEAAHGGRPITTGAIIPKPVGPGQVYVGPAFKRLPYGRPHSGSGLCKIGNPGAVRTQPFTDLEVGTDAPAPASSAAPGLPGRGRDTSTDVPETIELPAD